MIDHLLEKSKIHPHISMELEEDEVVGGFVGHDLGVAIVPDMAVYDLLPIKKIKIKDDTTQIFFLCDHPLEIKLHDAIKDCCSAKISKAYAKERSKESV